jgi:diaminopimelate decarboxylase
MNHFDLVNGVLHAEDVPLPTIADQVGTPVYVYSRATLERHAQVFRDALSGLDNPHLAFAVKANPNLAVLKVLARQGYGADVVSGGEMDRALAAGMAAEDIVFSGVGKTAEEIVRALKAGIGQFNIESEEEGRELATLANTLNLPANAVLRINPDVDAGTHGKISTGKADNKFGVGIWTHYRASTCAGSPCISAASLPVWILWKRPLEKSGRWCRICAPTAIA